MSHASASTNFQLIFNNTLKAYEKHTKNDLLAHPLAAQLQACQSPSSILLVLQQQVQELNQSRTNERLTRWLDPTVNVLYAFSATLGEGVGLVSLRDTNSSDICILTFYLVGILTGESDFCGSRCPPFSEYPTSSLRESHSSCNAYIRQAARDVRASQETLIETFERIENFFRRLEIYTEVPPSPEMIDMMVKIILEVLSILGITTKEIKQGRTSG
jgi:hypothetical protein